MESQHHIHYGAVTLNTDSRTVSIENREVNFTPVEFTLLQALLEHPGYVRTRAQLMKCLNHETNQAVDRIIDVYVRNISRKLQAARLSLGYVETVFGAGYRIDTPG